MLSVTTLKDHISAHVKPDLLEMDKTVQVIISLVWVVENALQLSLKLMAFCHIDIIIMI